MAKLVKTFVREPTITKNVEENIITDTQPLPIDRWESKNIRNNSGYHKEKEAVSRHATGYRQVSL